MVTSRIPRIQKRALRRIFREVHRDHYIVEENTYNYMVTSTIRRNYPKKRVKERKKTRSENNDLSNFEPKTKEREVRRNFDNVRTKTTILEESESRRDSEYDS